MWKDSVFGKCVLSALFLAVACSDTSSDEVYAGSGGSVTGTGGSGAGTGGADPGTGGSMPGTGGATAGIGGSVAGIGGAVAGVGGAVAGTGGAVAGTGGDVAGTGGDVAGTGGDVAGTGGAVACTTSTLPCGTQYHHPAILLEEFTYDSADFSSIHASSIEDLPNGDLVVVYFGGPGEGDAGTVIRYQRKPPDGTWSTPIVLGDDGTASGTETPCWNPVIYQVPGGDLLFWWKVGPNPSRWWGMLKRSSDNGQTWSADEKLGGDSAPDVLGPVKNKPVQLANGDILAGSSRENQGWVMHAERSTDNGATWSFITTIENGASGGAIQPSILTYDDGRIQMVARDKGGKKVMSTWSSDNGTTWTPTSALTIPNNNAGLDGVTLCDGRQLLVYNHSIREGGTSVGPESGNKGRSLLNVSVSLDGEAWEAAVILESPNKDDGRKSYPAVIQSADGLVHITYTYLRKKVKHVVLNPECLTETTPMPDGKWPASGPASIAP